MQWSYLFDSTTSVSKYISIFFFFLQIMRIKKLIIILNLLLFNLIFVWLFTQTKTTDKFCILEQTITIQRNQ